MTVQNKVDQMPKTDEIRVPVDPIHSGLRAAVMGTFVGGGVLGFIGTLALVPGSVVLAFGGGIALAAGGSYGLEQILKRRWPSGRVLVANDERIALTKDEKIEAVVDGRQQVNPLGWYFTVKKETPRARKGHYVVALSLEQDDTHVIVYSIATPDQFENMPASGRFQRLERSKKEMKKNLKAASSMRHAGEQRRLQEAEIVRQLVGGDIPYPDFVRYVTYLQANFPQWMFS